MSRTLAIVLSLAAGATACIATAAIVIRNVGDSPAPPTSSMPAIEATVCTFDPVEPLHVLGSRIYARCRSCHSLDGSTRDGPSWLGLWNAVATGDIEFDDGTRLAEYMANGGYPLPEEFIAESIRYPGHRVRQSFPDAMPSFQGQLTDLEIMAIIEFMQCLDEFDAEGRPLEASTP